MDNQNNDLRKPLLLNVDDCMDVPCPDVVSTTTKATASVCNMIRSDSAAIAPHNHNKNKNNIEEDDDDVQSVWFICSMKVMESTSNDDEGDDESNEVDLEKNLFKECHIDDKNLIDNDDASGSSSGSKWYWNCFISAVLPMLLYFQFYITYHANGTAASTGATVDLELASQMILMNTDWSSIQWSIFLFTVTSVLYRHSMTYNDTNRRQRNAAVTYYDLFLHLIPDIIIDVLLVLILFHYYVMAILLMQISTIFLAVNAILNSCNCSIRIRTSTTESTAQ
jgi:hypothetical protein